MRANVFSYRPYNDRVKAYWLQENFKPNIPAKKVDNESFCKYHDRRKTRSGLQPYSILVWSVVGDSEATILEYLRGSSEAIRNKHSTKERRTKL